MLITVLKEIVLEVMFRRKSVKSYAKKSKEPLSDFSICNSYDCLNVPYGGRKVKDTVEIPYISTVFHFSWCFSTAITFLYGKMR